MPVRLSPTGITAVANGGTGSSSASGALTALGAASSTSVPATIYAATTPLSASFVRENSATAFSSQSNAIWTNTAPYAYWAINRDFGSGLGGGAGGPVAALYAIANNTGTGSDAVAIMGDSIARINNAAAVGAYITARSAASVTGLVLTGLKVEVSPAATATVTGGYGLSIGAYNLSMPIPAIFIGGGSSGKFNNGIVMSGGFWPFPSGPGLTMR